MYSIQLSTRKGIPSNCLLYKEGYSIQLSPRNGIPSYHLFYSTRKGIASYCLQERVFHPIVSKEGYSIQLSTRKGIPSNCLQGMVFHHIICSTRKGIASNCPWYPGVICILFESNKLSFPTIFQCFNSSQQ